MQNELIKGIANEGTLRNKINNNVNRCRRSIIKRSIKKFILNRNRIKNLLTFWDK